MEVPKPDQIFNYPKDGNLYYLFSKNLSKTDQSVGLTLVGSSNKYLQTLPQPMLDRISEPGLPISLYAPFYDGSVLLKSNETTANGSLRFRLHVTDWNIIARENNFRAGQRIQCWALYREASNGEGELSLLVQEDPNEADG